MTHRGHCSPELFYGRRAIFSAHGAPHVHVRKRPDTPLATHSRRCWTRRPGRPEQSVSSLLTTGVCGFPDGCSSRDARTAIQRVRISVSSPLLDGYDEPEILP